MADGPEFLYNGRLYQSLEEANADAERDRIKREHDAFMKAEREKHELEFCLAYRNLCREYGLEIVFDEDGVINTRAYRGD